MTLAQNLKRFRTRGGLTQDEVARKAKVSQAFICQLETGVLDSLTLTTLRRLAKALKVTLGELVK